LRSSDEALIEEEENQIRNFKSLTAKSTRARNCKLDKRAKLATD